MLDFKRIELEDKLWADELLRLSDFRGCEYSFGNNYIWQEIYDLRIARYKDFYLVKNKYGYFFPAGAGDLQEVIAELKKDAERDGRSLFLSTMNKASLEKLEALYGGRIEVGTNRDLYDYVYEFEALSTLKGKKLHSKRNHLNRFRESNWSYEAITPENIDECKAMSLKWCETNSTEDKSMQEECCAVRAGLEHFEALGFKGGLLRVDGDVHAFTFGERLNNDTFVVHVEKAFTEVQGAYPAINYEFLNHECQGYTYINREEDTGAENLRKAKLSYKPVFLEEKFYVKFTD